MTSRVVLDTSAVLALVFGEAGHERVTADGAGALMSAVSYSETLAKCLDRGVPVTAAEAALRTLQLTIIPFDSRHATVAAALRFPTRAIGASFAARACMATAALARLPAMTSDRDWAKPTLGIELVLIR